MESIETVEGWREPSTEPLWLLPWSELPPQKNCCLVCRERCPAKVIARHDVLRSNLLRDFIDGEPAVVQARMARMARMARHGALRSPPRSGSFDVTWNIGPWRARRSRVESVESL